MVVVLEAARRTVGLALPVTALVFLLYGLFLANLSPSEMVDQMYLTTEGIFGIPIMVMSSYIILFFIFGSLLLRSGAGKFFLEASLALTGHRTGG